MAPDGPPVRSGVTDPVAGTDVLLADGTTAHVRSIRPADAEALVAFHARLSPESVVLRFFGAHPRLSHAEVVRFTHVDGVDRLALVAERDGDLVAVARYDRPPGSEEAEVAFVVEDAFQGRGIATILLEHLASAARARGVRRFVADTLSENFRMLHVFRDAGFARRFSRTAEVTRVVLDIAPSTEALAAMDEHDATAVIRSMTRLLRPASVAVVGVGPDDGAPANRVAANLVAGGFTGAVHLVGAGEALHGLAVLPGPAALPGPVDLAVVAVPGPETQAAVEACGRKGAGMVVVAGPGPVEGADHALVRSAHRLGTRVVGPDSLGVVSTEAGVSMNATTAAPMPAPGPVALASQSGGVGLAVLADVSARGLGVSSFVSFGHKADVSGNDVLQWWEHDTATAVVLLYLESFGNPRRFARVARRLGRSTPVVAVVGGRSDPGRRSTRAPAAPYSPGGAVDALLRHTGVIPAETARQLVDVAAVLALQPLPRGHRVGIVGTAGGPGVLAADACARHGLAVPEFGTGLRQALGAARAGVATAAADVATTSNPVDLGDAAGPAEVGRAAATLARSGEVDAVLVILAPPLSRSPEAIGRALDAAMPTAPSGEDRAADAAGATGATEAGVTIVACLMGAGQAVPVLVGAGRHVPVFDDPEAAVRALARVADHARWRAETRDDEAAVALAGADGVAPARAPDPNAARRQIERRIPLRGDTAGNDAWLEGRDALAVLEAHGVPCSLVGRGTGLGGSFTAGFVRDPAFGPLVHVELGDSAGSAGGPGLGLAPLTPGEARRMVLSLPGAGGPAAADRASRTDALACVLVELGRVAEDLPEVVEATCSLVLSGDGAEVVGARLRVAAQAPEPDGRRHLR